MSEHEALTPPAPTTPTLYTLFSALTGEIIRSGTCQYQSLGDQSTSADEIVVEGAYPDDQFVIAFTDAGWEAVPRPPSLPTAEDVWRERDRRLTLGFDFSFGDARGTHRIGTSASDMAGWEEVTTFAQALINAGTPDGTIMILTDTGPAAITAAEWQQILLSAAAFRQPLWLKSFEIAAMAPIPADFADAYRWGSA